MTEAKKIQLHKDKVIALISTEIKKEEMTMKSAKLILEKFGLGKELTWKTSDSGKLTAWS